MSLIRTPPRPPFEGKYRKGRRVCPMCGETPEGKRRTWHPECVELWHYIAFPQSAISLLVKTHGRICWGCGIRACSMCPEVHQHVRLELEHKRPLWSLNDQERLEHKWWLPFNLQLLCRACHRIKTAREAADRYVAQNPDGSLARKRRIAEHGYDPLEPQLPLITRAS